MAPFKDKEALAYQLSSGFYVKKDSLMFRKWNRLSNQLAARLNKKSHQGRSHWDLATFFYRNSILDSAYYQYSRSKKLYESDNDLENEGLIILNMSILKERIKDYMGSEVAAIKALRIFKELDNKTRICTVYNTLGIAANGLQNYNQSLRFHSKAETLEKELNKPYLQARSLNNMGVVYLHMEEYGKATKLFRKALRVPELRSENPRLYAMLLGNLAHSS